jgi:predicted ABC-type sugar transport system permease subunit
LGAGAAPGRDETALLTRDMAAGRLAASAGMFGGLAARARNLLLSEYFVLVLTIAYFVALLPFLPTLSNPANLSNTLSNVWPLFAVAIGQTFVLAIGGIDLSQGAVVGLTSVVGAMLLATVAPGEVLSGSPIWGIFIDESGGLLAGADFAVPMALLAMLLVAVAIGSSTAVSIAWFRMPPLWYAGHDDRHRGFSRSTSPHSRNIGNLPEQLRRAGQGRPRLALHRQPR